MKWGMQAFDTFGVVPPGFGIVHQVNLEYLARGVHKTRRRRLLPRLAGRHRQPHDDDQRHRRGRLGRRRHRGRGRHARPAGLLPDARRGRLRVHRASCAKASPRPTWCSPSPRSCASEKVVGKFVEFFGEGTAQPRRARPRDHRQHGARVRRDDGLLPGRREDDRVLPAAPAARSDEIEAFEAYFKAQGLFGVPRAGEIDYTQVVTLDLGTVAPSLAGPKRPQDRIEIGNVKTQFTSLFSKPPAENGFNQPAEHAAARATSCAPRTCARPSATAPRQRRRRRRARRARSSRWTRTSRRSPPRSPRRESDAADGRRHDDRQRRRADRRDHLVHQHLEPERAARRRPAGEEGGRGRADGASRTSRPRSRRARASSPSTSTKAGLLPYLEKLGFALAAYGCTTCIGNAGDLTPEINEAITKNDLVCAAVLSGNRNFEARIHPNLKANFLASPPLVVAYAIAGTVLKDLMTEPVGKGKGGTRRLPRRHLADAATRSTR